MKKVVMFIVLIPGLMILYFVNGQYPQGCILNDFQPKIAVIPPYEDYEQTTAAHTVKVTVNHTDTIGKVSKYIYGNNANIYMNQMVNQTVLLNYIETSFHNIIRFPGGNLSSVFFWNASPGAPPSVAPDSLVNSDGIKEKANYWFGKNNQSWTMSKITFISPDFFPDNVRFSL